MRRSKGRRGLVAKDKILIGLTFFFMFAGTGIFGAIVYHKSLMTSSDNGEEGPAQTKKNDTPFKKGQKAGEYLDKNGSLLLLVKAGKFTMGAKELGGISEKNLGAYLIDRTEVTYGQYQKFIQAEKGWQKGGSSALQYADENYLKDWNADQFPQGKADFPVVWVSWYAAKAYAKWMGKSLLSEAQWERAARGTDGRIYPWGNDQPDESRCNFGLKRKGTMAVTTMEEGASPVGCLHMAGNVWEWCLDDYQVEGMEGMTFKALRGGSWKNIILNLTTYYRTGESPEVCDEHIGFRCGWAKK